MLILTESAVRAFCVLLACAAVFALFCAVAVVVLCFRVKALEDTLDAGAAPAEALPAMYRPDVRVERVIPAAESAPAAAPAAPVSAAGSGVMSVFDVPDRTAAKLMAIVAEEMKVSPAQLRFLSIREVK